MSSREVMLGPHRGMQPVKDDAKRTHSRLCSLLDREVPLEVCRAFMDATPGMFTHKKMAIKTVKEYLTYLEDARWITVTNWDFVFILAVRMNLWEIARCVLDFYPNTRIDTDKLADEVIETTEHRIYQEIKRTVAEALQPMDFDEMADQLLTHSFHNPHYESAWMILWKAETIKPTHFTDPPLLHKGDITALVQELEELQHGNYRAIAWHIKNLFNSVDHTPYTI